ncbi:hypothetical protein [Nocardia sp. NBC_01327]|uniref:hypothetical protein n=1 Tax=Nocardia sp. NBC_01327 TaxID=2903593 RepID=UPI002E0EC7B8|nr:hypothetical protein OG326_17825 [Nocardia sp. NBC_01327]
MATEPPVPERRWRVRWFLIARLVAGALAALVLIVAAVSALSVQADPSGPDSPAVPLLPVSVPLHPKWLDSSPPAPPT